MKTQQPAELSADHSQRGPGRPPKPIDLFAAFDLSLAGVSIREQARRAGRDARTLMGRYAEQIELAQARFSGFLRMRIFELAVRDKKWPALHFLMREFIRQEEEQGGESSPEPKKWTRRQFRRAWKLVWRDSQPAQHAKPKAARPQGATNPPRPRGCAGKSLLQTTHQPREEGDDNAMHGSLCGDQLLPAPAAAGIFAPHFEMVDSVQKFPTQLRQANELNPQFFPKHRLAGNGTPSLERGADARQHSSGFPLIARLQSFMLCPRPRKT